MERTLVILVISMVLLAYETFAQECAVNMCTNGENCYTRNSAEGYVCECNLPFRDSYNCAIGPDNQEIFTCYGPSCTAGVFESLNYPSPYPNRYRALYLLYIPGASGISFTFDDVFGIETDKDELYVGKGLTVDFTALNGVNTVGPDVRFFEGFARPADFTLENTDTAWMYFITDKNLEYSGFSIRYQMVDDMAPVIENCPNSLIVSSTNTVGGQVFWTPPTATDISQITTLSTHNPGDVFPIGTTTVTYTFTDTFGNSNQCSFDVTVQFVDNVPPVISNCPASFTVTTTSTAGGQAFWTAPTATDVSQVTTSSTHNPGATFPVGTTTVTYTFTDTAGNSDQCSFDVTVQFVDTIPPTITNCPQSFTRTAPFGSTTIPVTWNEPTATDNLGTPTLVIREPVSGSPFAVGQTTTVLYRWTDSAGLSSDCTFDVTVIPLGDTTPPVVTFCPDDITRFVPFQSTGTTVTWTEPTATDNSGSVTTTQTHTSGSFFATGSSQTVTYTFRDAEGNEAQCQFNVRIFQQSDTVPPVVSICPENIALTVPFQSTGTTVSWNEPTVSDNSGTFTTTQTHNSGDFFNVNTQTTVTYTFTDAAGNQAFCTFTVTVTGLGDNTPPVITSCPSDITMFVPFQSTGTTVTWTEPVVSDDSGSFDTVQTRTSGSFFTVGDNTVTYTFRDAAGNEVSCSFVVRIIELGDTEAPVVADCPPNEAITVPFQSTGTTVTWTEPTVNDNSGTFTTTQTHNSGDFFNANTQTTVTYTFTDAAGNQAFCTFTVTVIEQGDTAPPVVTSCPSDITQFVPFLSTGTSVTWTEPTVLDNSGAFDTVQTRTSGSFFPVGETTVTYTFRDASNNEAICSFVVRVIELGDTEAPVVSVCPENIALTVPFQSTGTTVSWNEPTVNDNSGTFTTTQTHNSGDFFNVNTQTPVTYTFTDAANNQAFCTFTVTVTGLGDTVPPVVTSCPDDITQFVPFLSTGTTVTWTEPTVLDNSGAFDTVQTRTSGSFFSVGETTVAYTFRDAANNEAVCSFVVRVIELGDTEAPVVSDCPDNIALSVPFLSTGTTVSWNEPTVNDNSGTFTTTQTHNSGDFFNANTQTTVTYTFTDAAGNQAFCIFTVTVTSLGDAVPPVITSCPSDITMFVPFLTSGTTVTWTEPVVSDNSGSFDTIQSRTSGSFFAVGDNTVTYTFRDAAGNENSCSFVVRIIQLGDTEAPVVAVCPPNEAITVPFQSTGTTVTWLEPTVTDNSGTFTTTQTHNSGDFFDANTQMTVTYTFTDAAGNQAFCTFTVTVIEQGDTVAPVVTSCPDDITQFVPFLSTGTSVTWTEPTVLDNSGAFDTVQTRTSGSFFPVGETTVMYTFRDAANNEAVCSFVVRVIELGDTEAPVVSVCPENIALTVPFQSTGTTVSWNEPTVNDNSGTFTTTQTHNSGDFFNVNTQTTVTYTFTDAAGNQAFCIFTVTVTELGDTVDPVITSCPADITMFVPFQSTGTTVTWTEPVVSDNSGSFDTIQSRTSGSFFAIGDNTVTYTFRDAAGNEASCSFVVRIIELGDTESPMTVVCPESMSITVPFQSTGTTVSWNEPTVTDNSGDFTTTQTHNSGDFFNANTQTQVTYTFTDAAGNQAFCIFTVTVIEQGDTVPPVVTSCPSDITQFVPFLSIGTTVTWTEPTVVDNSGAFDTIQTHTSGSFFPVGESTVTYTFRDAASNEAVCSFVVRVIEQGDTTPPDVTSCPDSTAVNVPFQSPGTAITWNEPVATDNSGSFTTTQTHDSGDFFNANTQTTVTYTFTDAAGNQAFCIFTVTVTELGDVTPPVVTSCPADITEFVPFLSSGTIINWNEPVVSDNSGNVATTQNRASGSFFTTGSDITVTYTFRDAAGNEAVCSFRVRVIELGDATPPEVTNCPADITINVPFQTAGATASWAEPIVTDNSGDFTTTQTHNSGDFFNANTQTPVTYTFTDAAGNQAFCTFMVTVTELGDAIPPVVTCPANINEIVQFGAGGAVITWLAPTVTDNSGSFSLVENTNNPGDFLLTGQTIVTYRYRDPAGNENSCSFTVTIMEVDTIPPVIQTCPSNIVDQVEFGVSGKSIVWTEPTGIDNTGGQVIIAQRNFQPGDVFPVGETVVTYVLVDPSGNQATCQFTITIIMVDTIRPTIVNCPAGITQTILTGTAPIAVQFTEPTATDNTGVVNLAFNSHSSGDLFPAGQTDVTFIFEDEAGNQATCMFTVTINEANPCLSQPCLNGGACISESLTAYRCLCTECFTGNRCELPRDACDGNTCQNGAACAALPGSCTQYECQCPGCFIGQFCERRVDSCENNQCANGAVCVSSSQNCIEYTCQCPPCYAGQFCDIPISACANHGCQNGGVCAPVVSPNNVYACSEYTCACTGCFTGERCEVQRDACNPNPCLNGAECSVLPDNCYSYTCQCNGCFSGFNCEIPISSPCDDNPCQNGGVCSVIQGTCASYACSCPNTHIGVNCEIAVTVNPNPCNSFPCLNGASCLTMDANHYVCLCSPNDVGQNCQSTIVSVPAMDLCDTSPCQNGATCFNSYNSNTGTNLIPQYTCQCTNGFTGPNCASPVVDNPSLNVCSLEDTPDCEQGATCSNAFHSFDNNVDYICNCPVGFIGHNCETISANPCNSNPCKNGAQCTAFNTYFVCTCPAGYAGSTCEIPVGDNIDPVIDGCPDSVNRIVGTGSSSVVTWTAPTATDNSGSAFLVYSSHASGSSFPVGTTAVTYVFSDPSSNYAICTFFITISTTVVDNTPPVISNCPSNRAVTAAVGATSAAVSWVEPTATDNSGATVNRVSTASPGDTFNLGSTTVTYTFTDISGNDAVCSFVVTVNPGTVTDNTPPVISNCPNNQAVTAAVGATSAVVTWVEPTATDNSGIAVTRLSNASPGDSFNLGSTTVTYTFTDNSGNEAVCSFVVTVNSGTVTDTTPPVISNCPMGPSATLSQGATSVAVTWTVPTATDNSGGTVTRTSTHNSGDLFSAGNTQVTYTFTDPSGNEARCQFVVMVSSFSGGDTQAPVISGCPVSQTVAPDAGSNVATVSWVEPTAVDNSGQEPGVAKSHQPPATFTSNTVTRVTYIFYDNFGNFDTCDFTITVTASSPGTDNIPPIISDCPNGITVTGTNNAVVSWVEPTATDNDGQPVSVVKSHEPNSIFNVGSTTVTYTFSDTSGNVAICSFVVTVTPATDNTPPVISNCPSNQAVTAAVGANSAVVTWVEPTATDNSGIAVTRSSDASPGDSFDLGSTTVTYTFTDNSGNENICSFIVTVNPGSVVDNTPPLISNCPTGASATLPQGATSVAVTWTVPTATDNSGGTVSRTSTHDSGDSFGLGNTQVTYTFTDPSGNEARCQFVVMVSSPTASDTTAPVISGCPASQTTAPDAGSNTATVSWIEPTATDNSGVEPGVSRSHTPPATFSANTVTRVVYTFFDNSGNFDTCEFTVTVTEGTSTGDNTPPVISNCPNGVTATGTNNAVVSWVEPTATDDDGQPVSVTRSHVPNSVFNAGSTTITYRFTDTSGNEAVCSFVVTVAAPADNTPPVITNCPGNQAATAAVGATSAAVTWVEPTATDNSGTAVTRLSNASPGDSFNVGSTTVTYTFTDNSGNEAVCSFVVVVSAAMTNTNPCNSNPCPADQNCYYRENEYLCLADGRRRRDVDQIKTDGCMCKNGGVCMGDKDNGHMCACPTGYEGILCEQALVDVCQPNPCANNGTCIEYTTTTYVCICSPGWAGRRCEQAQRKPDPDHSMAARSEWSSTVQLMVGCSLAVLGTVVIVLAATVCRLAPRRFNGAQKFRIDEATLVQ
ncbi:uncharacterized protein LOC110974776 isoform X2 [Acanthaster planci]|uniref:Uncharacterized protein LOC110974776 isoform X2 n=1 Tax=Acanthaster planci TaxID=133434 RepID=A0A8B7XND9_ACAPL|nr:uncharacterized protein LOC110974776 isoform X2 [Acanthaster planci]